MAQTRKPRLPQALSALAFADYRRFAASLLLTSLGTHLIQTAVFWQVYELTGSALLLGLSGVARAVPHMVLSLAGGVIADRFNRVRLIQAGQVTNAALVLALATLTLGSAIELWHLYAITFLNSAFTAVTQPARTALLPSLVPQGSLVNAIALNATIGQMAQIVGPAMAGVGIATVGLGVAYLVNGIFYLIAMVVVLGVHAPPLDTGKRREAPWRSLAEGLGFVRSRPVIIWLLVIDLGETILGSYRALLPIFADILGVGPSGYGLLSAAPGVGSLLGATLMLSLGDMRYKGLYTVFGVLAYCVALVVLALSPWFLVTLVAAAMLGATNSIQLIPRNAVILAISPARLRGRVDSFRTMMSGGGPPIGYTVSGAMAALLGAPLALTVGAIACVVLVIGIALGHRELRERDLGAGPPPEA